jgi:CRISPR-associated protein Cmr4
VGNALKDNASKVFFSDLDFEAAGSAEKWATWIANKVFAGDWQSEFVRRFAVVPDDDFNFLSTTACEVTARVRIDDEKKTVARGALWYEEALPAESILAGIVWCDGIRMKTDSARSILQEYCKGEEVLQIGGKATVGRGRTRVVFGG